ncbi:MAG: hypothetical protein ACJASQ_003213 [Crocinitomicaceae bacterium]|jgi:hypothetical protein
MCSFGEKKGEEEIIVAKLLLTSAVALTKCTGSTNLVLVLKKRVSVHDRDSFSI